MAAEDEEKADSAARSAEALVEAVKANIRPLDLLTKEAFENAISVIMAVWVHQCRAASVGHCPHGRRGSEHRRLRAHPSARAGDL